MALATLLDVVDGGDPAAPALIVGSGGGALSRAQLRALALRAAAALRAAGVRPGDVVTIAEPNTVEFVVAFLGVALARGVAAPLNQNYTPDEFKYYMEDAGATLLLVGPAGNAAAEAAELVPCLSFAVRVPPAGSAEEPALQVTSRSEGAAAPEVPPPDGGAAAALAEPPAPEDVGLFLHTSGTTSRPKGVPLTHANLTASLANIIATYDLSPADVSLLAMPLFHVHGLMAGTLAVLAAGGAVVLPAAGRFSAATFWPDAVDNNVTFFTAVPTIHQILVSRAAADFPAAAPPPLRVIRSCSASLAPATLAAVEAAFGAPVLEAYAMTEAAHQMTSNPLPKHGARRPGTVGKAQGSVSVAILDADCKELGVGAVGEVCVRGPNVTAGYRANPAANAEAYAGGWFHTGDQGFLDAEGYLTLTGRLKELINRGGEKISPLEVDAALLAHPEVAEAVSFAAPDEKYGEVVAAAVVLTPAGAARAAAEGAAAVAESVRAHCGASLSGFKVPAQVFLTDALPKNATGKIQRRFMVEAFMGGEKKDDPAAAAADNAATAASGADPTAALPQTGATLAARALARLGVRSVFGVVGIPVTQLASAAQAAGARFFSCRNEQAAGYAASAAGFLGGAPGAMLAVSGPGLVHALAGLANAQVNCWPLVLVAGSCARADIGRGAFQELDQLAAAAPYVKLAVRANAPADVPAAVLAAYAAAAAGRPGAAYVDIPSDVLLEEISLEEAEAALAALPAGGPPRPRPAAPAADVAAAAALLRAAARPLAIVGKGAAYARAEAPLRALVAATGLPFLATSMGRGVVSDEDARCANAARSAALAGADVALVFGGRLNWQLHFGAAPKWAPGVKFILVDPAPSPADAARAAVVLRGDAGAVAEQLLAALASAGTGLAAAAGAWAAALAARAGASRAKLAAVAAAVGPQPPGAPLDYAAALRVIRAALDGLDPRPVVVAEGANTMDQARLLLGPARAPRCRLDAGTWGTMGVGPGYAMAAAATDPGRRVVALEGDSAFGFSAMEVETMCRYRLPITVLVFNNGGIYGGDRRPEALRAAAAAGLARAGAPADPPPTAFVPGARYELLAEAFGGAGAAAATEGELADALAAALVREGPTVINIAIDPAAGVESASVHAFNFSKDASAELA